MLSGRESWSRLCSHQHTVRTKPSALGFLALAYLIAVVVAGPLFGGWTESARIPVLAGLAIGAMLASLLDVERASERDRAVMPPSFIFIFATLLLLGPNVTAVRRRRRRLDTGFCDLRAPLHRSSSNLPSSSALPKGGARASHTPALGMAPAWPWLALPLAAALFAYYLIQSALVELRHSAAEQAAGQPGLAQDGVARLVPVCDWRQRRDRGRASRRSAGCGPCCRSWPHRWPSATGSMPTTSGGSKKSTGVAKSSTSSSRACPCSTATAASRSGTMRLERIARLLRANGRWASPLDRAVPALGQTELPASDQGYARRSASRARSRTSRPLRRPARGSCRSRSSPSPAA